MWGNPPVHIISHFRACLHGGGGPQVSEVTRLGEVTRLFIQSLMWSPNLSCKLHQMKVRDNMDRGVTPPKQVTSTNLGSLTST